MLATLPAMSTVILLTGEILEAVGDEIRSPQARGNGDLLDLDIWEQTAGENLERNLSPPDLFMYQKKDKRTHAPIDLKIVKQLQPTNDST
jgi:hypothetical protein